MRASAAIGLVLLLSGCGGVGLWSAPREEGSSAGSGSSSSGSGSTGSSSSASTGGSSSGTGTTATTSGGSTGSTSATGTTGGTTTSSSTGGSTTTGTTGVVTTATVETLGVSSGTLTDVALAADGTLLAVDGANNCIQSFDAQGTAHTWAGTCSTSGWDTDGQRLGVAQFYGPVSLALSGTTLYVGEEQGEVIRAIDTGGNVSTFSGSGSQGSSDGASGLAQFDGPEGLCPDGAGGLYVADTYNHRIRHVDASGAVQTIAGSSQGFANANGLSAQFDDPLSIAMDGQGNLFVADSGNCAIRKIAPNHDVSTFATIGTNCAQAHRMYGVAVDASGNVFAANLDDSTLYRWRPDGTLTAQIQGQGLVQPRNIKVDSQGRVLIANTGSSEVLRVTVP